MSNLQTLRFFVTPEHDCSYIPKAQASTLFVDPQAEISQPLYSHLAQHGFRRSGTHIYRPNCEYCAACISARLPAEQFKYSKSQRRVRNKNADLTVETINPRTDQEIWELYQRYITSRHYDGDMYPPTDDQFQSFLVETNQFTQFHLFRNQAGELLAVAVTDRLDDGLSAIYTFFSPDHDKRSLGVYAVLWQIEYLKQQNLKYLYLGYWVKSCRKMTYKSKYSPLEILLDNQWVIATDAMIN